MIDIYYILIDENGHLKYLFITFNNSVIVSNCVLVMQLCLILCDPMDYSSRLLCQAPLSMEFSRQEY